MTKYRNKKVVADGITFDSIKESECYKILKILQKTGKILKFELQPKFDYNIQYQHNGKNLNKKAFYKADFKVFFTNDNIEIWDVKGFKTAIYKRKKKIIEFLYDIKIFEK